VRKESQEEGGDQKRREKVKQKRVIQKFLTNQKKKKGRYKSPNHKGTNDGGFTEKNQ